MVDYVAIPNSSFGVGKPIRSVDGLALRDNPHAICKGRPGAPRVELEAWERLEAGDVIKSADDANINDSVDDTIRTWGFVQAGSVRMSAEIIQSAMLVDRVRNGDSVQLLNTLHTGTSFLLVSVDVDVLPGDEIIMTITGRNRFRRLSTNGQAWIPGVAAFVEAETYA
jgi:hypothetical protein